MKTVALITGANRGLGLETARQLGHTGVRTIIAARDAAKGEQAASELRAEGIDAGSVVLDVTSPASVRAAATQVTAEYGVLDILVNNAGVLPEATADETPEALDLDLFRQTFDTNVFGAVTVIQEFLPLLRQSASGRIVNVSTTMGSLSDASDPESPYYGVVVPAYQASKASVNAITVALAKLLRDTSIKVNSICPGWVQTDLGGADNRAAAPLTAKEAAPIIVEMASIPDDGPSGEFVDRYGPVAW
jgi:NAD(P)-dependent dehydrogenase (short-subunit alcohol dehydrogenase family)